jgi:tRNA-specific adenosine deaminase 1
MEDSPTRRYDVYDHELISDACLNQYHKLQLDRKQPAHRADGRQEWTILAGVVLSWPEAQKQNREYKCISLATGVKAAPHNALSPHGDTLHDCHAEVLARRSARQWVLDRVRDHRCDITRDGIPLLFDVSERESRSLPPYQPDDQFSFHLYCSSIPCGDMSSALVMQRRTDSASGTSKFCTEFVSPSIEDPFLLLRGRDHSTLAQTCLRTKPGRPQSVPSISLSCTDKIARWAILGFQGALLAPLTGQLYFSSLTFGNDYCNSQTYADSDQCNSGKVSSNVPAHCATGSIVSRGSIRSFSMLRSY